MARVLVLTEAGEGIGYGHLARCLALCQSIEAQQSAVTLLVDLRGEGLPGNGRMIQSLDWRCQADVVASLALEYDIAVVDSYLADASDYQRLKTSFRKVVAIDDYNRLRYPVDLIINPNIYRASLNYANQTVPVIGGGDYVILRSEFRAARGTFRIRQNIENLLITFGGRDARCLVPALLTYFHSLDTRITVLAGTDTYRGQLTKTVDSRHRLYGSVDAAIVAKLMIEADLVITAAGQTLNELACLGIPAIGICVGPDQEYNLRSFCQAGFLSEPLFWDDRLLFEKLQGLLSDLGSADRRLPMARAGTGLVDGNGVQRLTDYLLKLN